MTLRALIFDVDGTLANTEKDGHRIAFNHAFKTLGLDWVWDVPTYGELLAVTGGKERIKAYVEHHRPNYAKSADFEDLVRELHRVKTDFYTTLLAEGGIPLREGVKRLLHEAREQGLRLAIATTTTPANVTALLAHALEDGEATFEVIGAGDIVPLKKPAPDIYQWVLQRMGLTPDVCLAFEDSENGIRSSRAAGLRTVITINEYTADHNFDGAVAVLDHLGEPDKPFRILQGCEHGQHYVDTALLKRWFDESAA